MCFLFLYNPRNTRGSLGKRKVLSLLSEVFTLSSIYRTELSFELQQWLKESTNVRHSKFTKFLLRLELVKNIRSIKI